jgi:Zn2+/Cd2+-exporting ATPase
MSEEAGIEDAYLLDSDDGTVGQICIHYDPQKISIDQVRKLARGAGAELEHRFGHLVFPIEPMHARQSRAIQSRVEKIAGVLQVGTSPTGVLSIEFDRQLTDDATIRTAIQKMGARILEASREPKPEKMGQVESRSAAGGYKNAFGSVFGEQADLAFSAICGVLLLTGWLLSVLTDVTPWLSWSLYLGAYGFGGIFMLREAIRDVFAFRFDIDILMLLAAVGAAALGEWAEGGLLLFLFSLGNGLEHYAMGRAKRAIEALAELTPLTALVYRDGTTEEVPVERLLVGDVVIVKPNERLPADGFVIKGEGSVNQAPITGESVPVDKRAVADPQQAAANPERLEAPFRAFAGTINGNNALEIQVTKLANESTLARVIQMVNEAETQKSPTQRFADRFERYFVPAVLALVLALLFAWTIIDESFGASFYRAMAVLVAASPCALAISTPSAVLSGVARAARGGVLIKGGGPLENLGTLGAIAFDKTGTLTEGKPRLTDVVTFAGVSEDELLNVAIAVKRLSDHPLAAAVVRDGQKRLTSDRVLQAHDVQSITGRGVKATVDGQLVYIGMATLFAEVDGPPLPEALRVSVEQLKSQGRTTMVVRRRDTYLGVLGLMDTPRAAAREVIVRLRELGIRRMIMLSGDNQEVADAVAREVGLDEARGDLMPEQKVAAIKQLSESVGVAMVGDGVNDAPAMARATVGIAMGAAGSVWHLKLPTSR